MKIVELESQTALPDDLEDLKRFAAQWRTPNFRQIKLNGNAAAKIKKFIKDAAALLSGEDLQESNTENRTENRTSDFSDFIEKTERGFTDVNRITDTINPCRPYSQRPRIREIGDTSDRGTEEN